MANSSNMSKRYKEYQQDQMMLLPPSQEDGSPDGHLASAISDLADEMDLSPVTQGHEEKKGSWGSHPTIPG